VVVTLLYSTLAQNNGGSGGTGGTGSGGGSAYSTGTSGEGSTESGRPTSSVGTSGTVGTVTGTDVPASLSNLLAKCSAEISLYGYCDMSNNVVVPINSMVFADCFVRSAAYFSVPCKIAYDAYRSENLYIIPDTGENVKYSCKKDLSQYCPELLSANWTYAPYSINETCLKQNYYHFDSDCQYMLAKWLYSPYYALIIFMLIGLGGCACCCCCFCLCWCTIRQCSKKTCRNQCRVGSRYQPLELTNDQAALNSPNEQSMTEMDVFVKSDSMASDHPVYMVAPQQYQYAMIVPPKSIDENTSEV